LGLPPKNRSKPWPQAVIFDLDGTLVDTADDIAAALNQTLDELGLPPHAPRAVRLMIGGGLPKLLDRALAAHAAALDGTMRDKAAARLYELYAARPAVLSRLYPGAAELLRALAEAGVACGLCTNKPDAISRDLLREMGIAEMLSSIQCGDGDLPKKPDPAGIARVMEGLGAAPETTIMVGDSLTDVKAARAAGLAGIVLVSYGYTATPARELGVDAVIDTLHEFPAALAALAARQGANL
jgi:phosphoglycolate phosphatase